MSTPGIAQTLDAYRRRAALIAALRAALVATGAALLAAELTMLRPDLIGVDARVVAIVILVAGLAASVLYARAETPSRRDAARDIDRAAHLQDLTITAVERADHRDDMSAAIARAATTALQNIRAARVYPVEPPRHWRRWSVLVIAVQVAAIVLTWRAPAARPTSATGAALTMPGSGAGAGPAGTAGADTAASRPSSTSQPDPAAGPVASVSAPSGAKPDATGAPTASAARDAAGAGVEPSRAPTSAFGAADRETADARNRYRQAAARAGDVIAQGRVPAARRGVVERYFTAIRPQGK